MPIFQIKKQFHVWIEIESDTPEDARYDADHISLEDLVYSNYAWELDFTSVQEQVIKLSDGENND